MSASPFAGGQPAANHWRALELRSETTDVLESIDEAFVGVDAQWRFTYLNAQAERIYGVRREELVGRVFWEAFPEALGTVFEREYRRAMKERVAVRLEEFYRPFGRWFEISVCPAPNGGLAFYFRDISRRKQAQALVEGQKQALELALHGAPLERVLEVLAQTVEAQSGDGVLASILLLDAAGRRLCHAAAPSLPEAYNRALHGLEIGPGVGSCGTAAATGMTVVVSDIATDPLWAEFRDLAREHRLAACWAAPILSSEGKVLGTFALYYREARQPAARDREVVELLLGTAAIVIERQIEARERRQAEEQLREADRRKDEFLATLAHELRNPLAPIRNSLHLLRLEGGGTDPRVHEMLERQVHHLIRLVDDLLEISRVTRGKIELCRERIDLAAVVQSAVETSRPLLEGGGHRLAVSLPPEPLILDADPVRLTQVLANLLNNAAKFTAPDGQIWLTARRAQGQVELTVRDTGIGIAPDMLPRVFDLFSQVDRSPGRTQEGLGIGLTLVRSLVEMHGGSVEAHSAGPGRGSEFVVRLPLAPIPAVSPEAPEAPAVSAGVAARVTRASHEPGGAQPGLATRRIALIDDNRDAADTLGLLLELRGAEVRAFYDGPAALAALETYLPTAVLLDIGMPGMDGYEVARRIRRQPRLSGVPLIALTGWGQEEDRRRAREAGFDHHLVKPVDLAALEALLAALEAG
jgi:PAS domain S-box-containing protein